MDTIQMEMCEDLAIPHERHAQTIIHETLEKTTCLSILPMDSDKADQMGIIMT